MSHQKTLQEVLRWASSFLKENGLEENVAYILLEYYLNVSYSTLLANMKQPLKPKIEEVFEKAIREHVKTGLPVQHITGLAPFYGREFVVNKHVLIPRFETEELVEHALEIIRSIQADEIKVIDVGTGSGIIAITLKLECPEISVYATDISKEAINVARKNAEKFGADIKFLEGDFLEPILKEGISPTLIISNPPYIGKEEYDELSYTVKNFDPHLALFSEKSGMKSYQDIIKQSKQLNQANLHAILFEIGYAQKEAISALINKSYLEGPLKVLKDINGRDRIILKCLK